jgi:hypothetical protein
LAGEEDELATIEPKANSLSLIYRDKVPDHNSGLLHFTKFVNHKAPSPMFVFNLIFRLGEADQSEESSGEYEKASN